MKKICSIIVFVFISGVSQAQMLAVSDSTANAFAAGIEKNGPGNTGTDTTEFTKSSANKSAVNLVIGAGLHINSISPSSTSPFYAAGGRSYTSTLPEVSFGANILTNPSTGKFVFRIELSLTESQYRSSYQSKIEPYIPSRADFDQTGIILLPQLIYNFYNGDNFKIYGDVGLAVELFSYSNTYYGAQNPSQATPGTYQNDFDFNTFDTTVLLKAGVQIGAHWGIFVDYLANTYATQIGYFALASTCKQVGLNYYFK